MGWPLASLGADTGPDVSRRLANLWRAAGRLGGDRLRHRRRRACRADGGAVWSKPRPRQNPARAASILSRGGAVPNLRGEGIPVDIKTGPRSYVVGPLSLRPDGGFYDPIKGLLGQDALPMIRTAPQSNPAPMLTGHRHIELVKKAMRMVELVDSQDELQANLAGIRDDWCADPATMPDSELRGIAAWAWKCRLENRIYRGRDSAFPVHRVALDALRGQHNGADAIALLVTLQDQHGHAHGKRFPLDFAAMRAAGLLNLSTPRLRAARRTLEGAGLLSLASPHRAGSKCQTYALTRPRPAITQVNNVAPIAKAQGGKVQGEGATVTYDARFQTNKTKGGQ